MQMRADYSHVDKGALAANNEAAGVKDDFELMGEQEIRVGSGTRRSTFATAQGLFYT